MREQIFTWILYSVLVIIGVVIGMAVAVKMREPKLVENVNYVVVEELGRMNTYAPGTAATCYYLTDPYFIFTETCDYQPGDAFVFGKGSLSGFSK